MLDTETKKRINDARDILVGKVPDPKSQVEQITIALIYKFMDDMDLEAQELGGERSFFRGEFKKYAWHNVFNLRLGGYEILNFYSEAIMKMNLNPNIPQLFRDIFKNAYLPYRDPETLKAFLKIINEFSYDHSERLGDAFEYLLSVLGSQGEAGQFRTPRHIIEFMVEVIDSKKDETILDPACGTAGFLISSYKHIIRHNSSNYDPASDTHLFESHDTSLSEVTLNSRYYKGEKLTPEEREQIARNIRGYDISPDMVRLSLVNMYLHGLRSPRIYEYDTLTSEDRWNEYADVILANPPFMSPKGGIRPHKRFSINSKRSEVLFVDYMAEHLTPGGRAAIIVPEGIIFQSGTAYKQLRKMLVEEYLVGVISLPAGVFNPYSGVKTSILWLDRALAKKTDKILFAKVENDGFDLGAQRRPVKQNDLPEVFRGITAYKKALVTGEEFNTDDHPKLTLVGKKKIAEDGEYNLSGERYKENKSIFSEWPIVKLGEVTNIISGQSPESKYYNEDGLGIPFYQGKTEFTEKYLGRPKKWTTQVTKEAIADDILMSVRAPVGPVNIATNNVCIGRGLTAIRPNNEKILTEFLFNLLKYLEPNIKGDSGAVFNNISKKQIENIQIPLPPLSVQQEIVEEMEGYQKIIDGARQVVENYKPRIDIDPSWPMVELGKVCKITSSKRIFKDEYVSNGIPFYRTKEIVELSKGLPISIKLFIPQKKYMEIKKKYGIPQKGDILLSAVGTIGISWVIDNNREFYFKDGNLLWLKNIKNVLPEYLKIILDHILMSDLNKMTFGSAYKALTIIKLKQLRIPIPPKSIQQDIINRIKKEQKIIKSNKLLIQLFEQKIRDRIAKVWRKE